MNEPEGWDYDDRCWAVIAELEAVPISAIMDFLNNGLPYVRVVLDDLYVIDCQIELGALFAYTIYVRRYDIEGNIVDVRSPYQANHYKQAAKCVELCHRVHEVSIRDNMERLEYALRLM